MRSEPSIDLHLDAVPGRRSGARESPPGRRGHRTRRRPRSTQRHGRCAALRKGGAQAVQDRLVGDLPRQADIARRDPARRRAHQGAAPVRRRAGHMRDAVPRRPRQEVRDRLARPATAPSSRRQAARAGKSAGRRSGGCHRTCSRRAAVARPRGLIGAVRLASDAPQSWAPGGAGGEQQPFGFKFGGRKFRRRRKRRRTDGASRRREGSSRQRRPAPHPSRAP